MHKRKWVPLHVHSTYSTLDSPAKAVDIAKRCNELEYSSCAISDHGSISGNLKFFTAMKEAGIKSLLGTEAYLTSGDPTVKSPENRSLSHGVILAKNLAGWKGLIKATSASHLKEHEYYKNRLNIEQYRDFANGNLISFSGHPGSELADCMFLDHKLAYRQTNYDEAKKLVAPDWEARIKYKIEQYQSIFGKENFWLEIQILDAVGMPASLIIARALRYVGEKMGVPRVATPDSHYVDKTRAGDQRVILCSSLKTTLKQIQQKINAEEDVTLGAFFKTNVFGIPSAEEVAQWATPDEMAESLRIADMCEAYDITGPPLLPDFDCPESRSQADHLRYLCEQGFKNNVAPDNEVYRARMEHELSTFNKVGLAGYFLVVQDVMRYARYELGLSTGKARGSAGGSLVGHLIGITRMDPIPYGLMFERFYDEGRNVPGKPAALPDIDCDFPVRHRHKIVEYVRNKYGADKIAHIATFGSMKGKGALKEVLRAHDVPFEEANMITDPMPEEARIADKLQEMGENASSIRYALEENPKDFSEWARLEDDGSISGVYGPFFEQAIRLEGVKRSRSTHASGIAACRLPLAEIVPMFFDKNKDEYIVGMEYTDAESLGIPKLDILGTAVNDKYMGVKNLCLYGTLRAPDSSST